jgi:hypothetical protein
VSARSGPQYGAILWDASADIDDAIRLVKAFADPQGAINLVASSRQDGQRWAVVDLRTMNVVAQGNLGLLR